MTRTLVLLASALLCGCVSQSAMQTHAVTDAPEAASGARRAQVHAALAGEYYTRGNYPVALAETKLAITDDASYMPSYNIQGLIYMQLREDVNARSAFDHALSLEPNSAEVLNNFGWFLCTRNDTDRAMKMIERAAADMLYPTPEKAYLSMGLCQRRMHQDDAAEASLLHAVQIRPDLIGALYNLSELSLERGKSKAAEDYLNRYMHLTTPSFDALVLGAKVTRATHDSAAEESYLQQLRRRYPEAPQTLELTGKRP